MATARDVIDRATVLLGVRASGEALEASQIQDCLAELNGMMHEFEANDGATTPTVWADIGLSDNVAIGGTDLSSNIVNHMGYALARRVAPLFGAMVPAQIERRTAHSESVLKTIYKTSTVVTIDPSLKSLRANYRWGS